MRVLVTTQPGLGHLHPMVPVAAACAAAGHRVLFACAESFRPRIEAFGFDTVAAGLDWLESEADLRFPELTRSWLRPEHHLRIVREVFAGPAALATAADLERIVRGFEPDLVLRNDFELGGAAIAERRGLPCATVGIELAMPTSFWQSLAGPQLARLRSDLGLVALPAAASMLGRGLHFPLLPPSYQLLDQRTNPAVRHLRPDPPPGTAGAGELPAVLAGPRRRPRIYATAGTVFNRAHGFFEAVLAGLADEDLDVVATVGPGWAPGDLARLAATADNALVTPYLPIEPLLDRCDLVITHGGVNTLLAAFRHRLPVLVIPLSAHHPFHALRVEALGVGAALQGPVPLPGGQGTARGPLTPEGVHEAVRRVLGESGFRLAAERLGDEIAALPGPERAVEALEALAAGERGAAVTATPG